MDGMDRRYMRDTWAGVEALEVAAMLRRRSREERAGYRGEALTNKQTDVYMRAK
jgi:hypothetical protein